MASRRPRLITYTEEGRVVHVIDIENGVTGYRDLVKHVLAAGVKRSPRGHVTLDAGPTTVVMQDVTESLPLGIGRGLNRRIAAVEAAQLVGGFSDPDLTVKASSAFSRYREPEGHFHGAYGNRIAQQFAYVIYKLKNDRDSRQAVATLWSPYHDNVPNKRDYPCTIALIFAIVNGRLELSVTMRSQDIWLGAPYDWFQFTQAQQTLARLLSIPPGIYRHSTVSTHLYGVNMADTDQLITPPDRYGREAQPLGFFGRTVQSVMQRAHDLSHRPEKELGEMNESERWYANQFATLLG